VTTTGYFFFFVDTLNYVGCWEGINLVKYSKNETLKYY